VNGEGLIVNGEWNGRLAAHSQFPGGWQEKRPFPAVAVWVVGTAVSQHILNYPAAGMKNGRFPVAQCGMGNGRLAAHA